MNEITREINKLMQDYKDELEKLADEEFAEVAKNTRDELRSTSPKLTGDYAAGWAVKKESGVGVSNYIVYNKPEYRLTHLLENGHVIRNKKGTYGRTSPIKHIQPAAEKAADELIERLESKL